MGFRRGSYWKAVRQDGYDLRGVYQYKKGETIVDTVDNIWRWPQLCHRGVIHASPYLLDAIKLMHMQIGMHVPQRGITTCLRMVEIHGRPVVGIDYSYQAADKHGFKELTVVDARISDSRAIELLTTQPSHVNHSYLYTSKRLFPPMPQAKAEAVVAEYLHPHRRSATRPNGRTVPLMRLLTGVR